MKKSDLEKKIKELEDKIEKQSREDFSLVSLPTINTSFFSPKRTTSQLLREYEEWVFANINARAERVSNIQLKMYRVLSSDNVQEVKTHELLELLNKVNDYMTFRDLVFNWVQHMDLVGEAYWYLVKRSPTAKPEEIWPLRPDYIRPVPGNLAENEFIKEYVYQVPGSGEIKFSPHEIIFFRRPHPTDPYSGIGVVEASLTTVETDKMATLWNRNFFKNSARPDAVLVSETNLTDIQVQRIRDMWQKLYGGTGNAHKMAVLEGGLKYQPLQQSIKDMDFLKQQQWTRDKIMALFGNTKIALGIVEDVNRANAEASEYVHIKNTIRPIMQRFVDALNEYLVPLYGKNYFLAFEDPVPEERELKLKEFSEGWNKWLTINEIREELGREAIEGGDTLYLPLNLISIDGGSKEQKIIKLNINQKKKDKIRGKYLAQKYAYYVNQVQNRNVRQKKILKKIQNKILKQLQEEIKKKNSPEVMLSEKKKETFWRGFVDIIKRYEKRITEKMKVIYERQKDEVLTKLRNRKSITTKNIHRYLFDKEKWKVEISVNLLPILEEIVREEGNWAMNYLGEIEEYVASEASLRYIERTAIKLSHSVVDTEIDRLKRTLQEGIEQEESIDKLTQRIENVFNRLERYQAERIARTEIVRASNFGVVDAYKQTGLVEAKMWYTAIDERVCEFCSPMNGKIVGIDENYFDKGDKMRGVGGGTIDFDYEDVGFPPLHPNCRCTVVPILKEWKMSSNWNKKEFAIKRRKDKRRTKKQLDLEKIIQQIEDEIRKRKA